MFGGGLSPGDSWPLIACHVATCVHNIPQLADQVQSFGIVACLVVAELAKLGQRASCPLGTHSSTGGTPVVPVFEPRVP